MKKTEFKLSDLLRIVDPEPAVRNILAGAADIATAMQRLIEAECYRDAYRLMACSMSLREAVWWGCLCVWDSGRTDALRLTEGAPPWSVKEESALNATVNWVRRPAQETLEKTVAAAKAIGASAPAGGLALAVTWSAIDQHDQRRSFLTVAESALLAGVRVGPEPPGNRLRRYLGLAIEVARGEVRWE